MFKVRSDEPQYAKLWDTETKDTNRYGLNIETTPEGSDLRDKSLNINNDDGIGVIRINDGGMMAVEYYKSIEDSKTVITNPSNNLIMLKCQDAVYFNRKNVRILCIDRYISITKWKTVLHVTNHMNIILHMP